MGQVAHVLTPDNFRLSPGTAILVRSNLLLFGATIVAVLSLKDAGVPGCQYQLADGEADNFGRPCPCIV